MVLQPGGCEQSWSSLVVRKVNLKEREAASEARTDQEHLATDPHRLMKAVVSPEAGSHSRKHMVPPHTC